MKRIAAMQLNATPEQTQRSREHFKKGGAERIQLQRIEEKIRKLEGKLAGLRKKALDLRVLYAPKGAIGEPSKANPVAGSTPINS